MNYNTDIDISTYKIIDNKSLNDIDVEFFSKYKIIPEEFNWIYKLKSDTSEILSKKNKISLVKNQHLCGCCWAISCATAISDCFVVKNLVTWNPNVSFTYALSKYPQQKCVGGSSRLLLEDIKNGDGIASDHCVDDSWCKENKNCNSGNASEHFFNTNKEYLSSLIPSEGCYDGTKKHFVFKIDDVYSLTTNSNLKILDTQTKIKQHIMIRGPVVAGFLIMRNFPSGDFAKKGNGIYFEEYSNKENNYVFDINKDSDILGSHSVVVVGWGLSKNQKYNNLTVDIPYWYCRNSWGKEWGENGYFKIAMYPFNKICQFAKRIRVIHENVIKEVGGVTGFNVTQPPELKFLKKNNYVLEKINNFFTTDENLALANIFTDGKTENIYTYYYILFFTVTVLVIFKKFIKK